MSKHTPGPWKWVDGPHLNGMLVQDSYRLGDEFIIALGEAGEANAEANARLIAAAPALLAALKDLLSVVGTTTADEPITQARAAIAQAEGHTP